MFKFLKSFFRSKAAYAVWRNDGDCIRVYNLVGLFNDEDDAIDQANELQSLVSPDNQPMSDEYGLYCGVIYQVERIEVK